MANRNWMNGGKVYSMHKEPVIATATIQIGASGAVTSFKGATIQSVTLVSTGTYKLTFQSQTQFPSVIFASGSMQSPSSGLSGISTVEIQNAPDTTAATATGAVITVKTLSDTDTLAAPASGSALNVMIIFNNSQVKS